MTLSQSRLTRIPASVRFAPDGDAVPNSGDVPTPPPPPSSSKPDPSGTATMTISREEYDRFVLASKTAEDASKKLKTFEEDWKAVETLMNSDGTDAETIVPSVRRILNRQGFTQEQIDAYIASRIQPHSDPTKPDPSRKRGENPKPDHDEEDPEDESTILDRRIQSIEEKSRRQELRAIESRTALAIDESLDTNDGLATLMESLAGPDPKDEDRIDKTRLGSVRDTIASEVRRELLNALHRRTQNNRGVFSEDWIPEEAKRATTRVYDKYKTLVGDPSRLRRSNPIVEDAELGLPEKPVPQPARRKGMTVDQAQNESKNWLVDQFARMAQENGPASRI